MVKERKIFCDFGKNLIPLFGRFVLANERIREEKNCSRVLKPQCPKGQLISKCLFGVDLRFHNSKVEFIRSFFGRNVGLEKSFRLCLTFKTD